MAGTTKSELPCRREHDFEVLSKSRKRLNFGAVLVPSFGAFEVSYRRKRGFQRCFIFARFLDRLLHHFKPPKSPPKACKMGIHFWNHFGRIRRRRSAPNRTTSLPGTPLSFYSSITQRPLRFAALPVIRYPQSAPNRTTSPSGTTLSSTFLAWEREARLIMRVLPTYARSSHKPSHNLPIFQYA